MEKKALKQKKIAAADPAKCKGCNLCLHVCPTGALVASKDLNKRGLTYVILEHPEKCTGCGLCALVCPDLGIEIIYKES